MNSLISLRLLAQLVGVYALVASLPPAAHAQAAAAAPDCNVARASLPQPGDPFSARALLLDSRDLGPNWCLDRRDNEDSRLSFASFVNTSDYPAPRQALVATQLELTTRDADTGVAVAAGELGGATGPNQEIGAQIGDGLGLRVVRDEQALTTFRVDRVVVVVILSQPGAKASELDIPSFALAQTQEHRVREVLELTPLPNLQLPQIPPDAEAHARAAARVYTITAIDSLPEHTGLPSAINIAGQIVGTAQTVGSPGHSPEHRAFLWQDGTTQGLGSPGGGLTGASAINDMGLAVGNGIPEDGAVHAVLWDGEAIHDLGQEGRSSRGLGINADGQIVGAETDDRGEPRAVIWDAGVARRLDDFDDGHSQARHINAPGQVLVTHSDANCPAFACANSLDEVYLWQHEGLRPVGRFIASGLNDRGEVIGYGGRQGLLWRDGTIFGLGSLGRESLPNGINNAGEIVGVTDPSMGRPHAFIWDSGVMTDLNDYVDPTSGWVLREAVAINDAGQIVGFGTLSGDGRMFLLTPAESEA